MKRLWEFWLRHPDAEPALRAWHKAARQEDWDTCADVRARFPHAGQVGKLTVFNIGGNKYRLVTSIHFNRGKVYVRDVLPHPEYSRDKWKK